MLDLEESLIKDMLCKFNREIILTLLFGSYNRNEQDMASDIDILVVYTKDHIKPLIKEEINQPSNSLNKVIHPMLYKVDEFESNLNHHDYLLMSILDDSTFIYGDQKYYFDKTENIMTDKTNNRSLCHNRRMGIKLLDCADRYFQMSQCTLEWNSKRKKESQFIKGIQNYHIGLGYLYAFREMKRTNEPIVLRHLLTEKSENQLEKIMSEERRMKRNLGLRV